MHYSILVPIWALVSLALYKGISMVVERRRHAAKAKELGCQDAPHLYDTGFLGLKHIKRMQAADAKKQFPDLLIEQQEKMSQLTGRVCTTFTSHIFGQQVMFTSDPKNIKAMLADQFDDFYLGPARRGNMMQTLGDGIFVQDGKAWEHSRALLRPNFAREQVSDLELEERHVQNLLKALPVKSDGWTDETNIQALFFRLTLDSATEFLFGSSVESQIANLPESISGKRGADRTDEAAFSANFDSAQVHMAKRFRLADKYWTHNPKEYKQNNKIVNDFVDHYVDIALRADANKEKTLEEGHKKEKYVFMAALAAQTRDPVEIRAQLLNILLAGRDTTASLLSWLFHLLLRDPRVFNKLRETVISEFGTYEDPKEISFSTLKGSRYLQYCLNETLRLWTVVPGNARRSLRPTTLPRGGGPDGQSPVYLTKDVDVNYSIHVMHRRKDLWGEDAGEFKPERFEGRRPGWEYLPFNGGPRICIGQQFALTEASYVIVRLLQKFDKIEPAAGQLDNPVTSDLTLTSSPYNKVTLKMHEASQ